MQAARTEAEIEKLRAETRKLKKERRKIVREIFWYPLAAGAALVASISGATVLILKVLGLLAV